MAPVIRAATADEAPAIAAAHADAHWETYQPLLGGKARRLERGPLELAWRRAFRDHALIRVIEDEGTIVGVGAIFGATLEWLYLRASHRGQGLGRRLLGELLELASAREVSVVTFGVHEANTAACAFYEAMGASRIGRQLIRHPDGDWHDLLYEVDT